jgi:hypothetical protein
MAKGNFKGKAMLDTPERLDDKAWTAVVIGC